ncbi:rhoptry associated membrane antigen [Clonorchis sinensis]|uniref:Rhoptry associated membrane antigen n=1 Tax=Clonorchis sinensis TaxID=79923 RepID=H2KUN4_CLOSI|nr:rhoptry associated membrane antigen [Clonorchis sinensis]
MSESGETGDPSGGYAKEGYVFSEDLDTGTHILIGDRHAQNESLEHTSLKNDESQNDLTHEMPDTLESPSSSNMEQQGNDSGNTIPAESSKEGEMENLQRYSLTAGMSPTEEDVDSRGEAASFEEKAEEFAVDNNEPLANQTSNVRLMSTDDITAHPEAGHSQTDLLSTESQQPVTTADTAVVSEEATVCLLPTEEESQVSFRAHSESENPIDKKITDTEVSIAFPESSITTHELTVASEPLSVEDDQEALKIVDENRDGSERVDAAQTSDESNLLTTTSQSIKDVVRGDDGEDDQSDEVNYADENPPVSVNTDTQETNEEEPVYGDNLSQESPYDSTSALIFENAPGETVVEISEHPTSETFTDGRISSDNQQLETEPPFVTEQADGGSVEMVSKLDEVSNASLIETQESQTNNQERDSIDTQDTEEKTSIVIEPESAPEGVNEINLDEASEPGEIAADGLTMNPELTGLQLENEVNLTEQHFGEMHAAPDFETGVESEEVFADESQALRPITSEYASDQLEQELPEKISASSLIRNCAAEYFSEDITAGVLELTGEPHTEQTHESVVQEYDTHTVQMSEVTVSSSVQDSVKKPDKWDTHLMSDTGDDEVIFESSTNGVQDGVLEEQYSFEQSKPETTPDQQSSEYLNENFGVLESDENVTGTEPRTSTERHAEILRKSSIQLEELSEMTVPSPVQLFAKESDHLYSISVPSDKNILSVESKICEDQGEISDNDELQPTKKEVPTEIPCQDVCIEPTNGEETVAFLEPIDDTKMVAKELHVEASLEGSIPEHISLSEKSLSGAPPVVKSLPEVHDNRVSDSNNWATRPSLFEAHEISHRTVPQEFALGKEIEVDRIVQVENKIGEIHIDISDAALTTGLNGYASTFGDDANKENLVKEHQSRGLDKRPLLERQQRSRTLDPRVMSDWAAGYSDSKQRAATLGRNGSRKRPRLQPKPAPNDDYLFPDSVTPSKVDKNLSMRSLSEGLPEGTYDVPYIDDDAFLPRQLRDSANQNGNIDDDSEYSSDGGAWYWQPPNYYQIHLDPNHIADTNECATTPRFMHPAKSSPSAEDDRKLIDAKEPKKGRKKNRLFGLCSCVSRQSKS